MPNIEEWVPEAQAAFVARMQTPAAYPMHPVSTPIRCVETHISWVFLTGRFAYKVKKPVRLSFLDYSTVARREACCREELRLNRRYAPDLYLDVVPIGGTPQQPLVGGHSSPAFEHALQMLQFDTTAELSALLDGGPVTRQQIQVLGTDIANLQTQASIAAVDDEYGTPARIHRVTAENFDELARTKVQIDQEHLDALRKDVNHRYQRLHNLMTARKVAGRVRECHGDLHCGNVVRWHDRLVPFDGIEFDPALRFIDVASDIAFLSMDLAARGYAGLRRTWLNSWTEASGDFAAIELLPYYEPYRALVRAKVASIRADANAGDSQSPVEMRRYLTWALARPTRCTPMLILMVGLSGSGKTWLAQRLATHIDAFHVRSDVERKRLAGLAALETSASPPDAGIYSLDFNIRTYARLAECAGHCLAAGENVIVDAASLRRAERAEFVALAARHGATLRMVHCAAPIEVLKERVAARYQAGVDASEATVALLDRQPSYWEPFTADEIGQVIRSQTSDAGAAEKVIAELRRER